MIKSWDEFYVLFSYLNHQINYQCGSQGKSCFKILSINMHICLSFYRLKGKWIHASTFILLQSHFNNCFEGICFWISNRFIYLLYYYVDGTYGSFSSNIHCLEFIRYYILLDGEDWTNVGDYRVHKHAKTVRKIVLPKENILYLHHCLQNILVHVSYNWE